MSNISTFLILGDILASIIFIRLFLALISTRTSYKYSCLYPTKRSIYLARATIVMLPIFMFLAFSFGDYSDYKIKKNEVFFILFSILYIFFALFIVFLRHLIGLFQTGYYRWAGKTSDGRENKKILNLVYYFILFPSILWYGFTSPLRDLPKIHGTPGIYSFMLGITRLFVGCLLLGLAGYISYQVYHSEKGAISIAGFVGVLCLLPPIYISFSWAIEAFKKYRLTKDIAKGLMHWLLSSDFKRRYLEIYWGQRYTYLIRNKIRNIDTPTDFDSKVKRFIKGIFGKRSNNSGMLVVELIIHNKVSDNYAVIEISDEVVIEVSDEVDIDVDIESKKQAYFSALMVQLETSSSVIPVIIQPTSFSEYIGLIFFKSEFPIRCAPVDFSNYEKFDIFDAKFMSLIVINSSNLELGLYFVLRVLILEQKSIPNFVMENNYGSP